MAQIASSKPAGISRRRINVIMIVSIMLSLFTARQLVEIQVYKRDGERDLSERARQELEMHVVLQPRRGTIYDRNGSALALNMYNDSLYVEPLRIAEPEKLALVLAPLLEHGPAGRFGGHRQQRTRVGATGALGMPQAAEEIRKLGEEGAPPAGYI